MKKFLTTTLIACAATTAAACPTGADLASGIRVVEADSTTHIYRDIGKGIVQVDITYDGGDASRNLLAQGNHVLQLANVENGAIIPDTIANTAYPTTADALPVPSANAVWSVETMVNAYGDIYAETQTQKWGAAFDLTIGTCTYSAIPGKLRYDSDGYWIDEGVYFIPDLGIALLHSYDAEDLDPENYTFVRIEAAQ